MGHFGEKEIDQHSSYAYAVRSVVKHDPMAAKVFTSLAVTHFPSIANNEYGNARVEMLGWIARNSPQAAKEFTPLAVKYFDRMKAFVIASILRHNPDAAKEFTPLVLKYFNRMTSEQLIGRIVELNPHAAKEFTPLAIEHFNTMHHKDIEMIEKHNPDAKEKFASLRAEQEARRNKG